MFDSNDPRLTAYVLGELDDASRTELEAELARSPELRQYVEDLRQAAHLLQEAFLQEPAPLLTPAQRQAILDESRRAAQAETSATSAQDEAETAHSVGRSLSSGSAPLGRSQFHSHWLYGLAVVAAVFLVGVMGITAWRQFTSQERLGDDVVAMSDRATAEDSQESLSPSSGAAPAAAPLSANRESGHKLLREHGEVDVAQAVEGEAYFDPPQTEAALAAVPDEAPMAFGASSANSVLQRDESLPNASSDLFQQRGASAGVGGAPGIASKGERQSFGGEAIGPEDSASPDVAVDRMAGARARLMSPQAGVAGAELARAPSAFDPESRLPSADAHEEFAPADPSSARQATQQFRNSGGSVVESLPPRAASESVPRSNEPVPAGAAPAPAAPRLAEMAEQSRGPVSSPALQPPVRFGAPAGLGDRGATNEALGERLSKLDRRAAQAPVPAPQDTSRVRDQEETVEEKAESGQANQLAGQPKQQAQRTNGPAPVAIDDQLDAGPNVASKKDAGRPSNPEQPGNAARTWRRVKATPNASRLMIGDRDELPLQGMQANVTIDGFRARVLLDLYFYNDRNQQLEGEFKLRLPEDGSLYYFAFGESAFEYRPTVDQLASRGFLSPTAIRSAGTGPAEILRARRETWTKVKEARIVPRAKAAHAYSETVRRRVDPALVEWSGPGIFNARVFPLMPGQLHRIVVGYDVSLTQDGDDLTYALDLPTDVSQVHVDLNLAAIPGAEAHVTPAGRPFLANGRAYYHLEGPWQEPVRVRIAHPGALVLHGVDEHNNRFFATRLTPKLESQAADATSPRAIFLVDTSLSANPDKFNVWLKLLEATLTQNRDTLQSFAVLFFNIESHWWKEEYVENTKENVQQLLNYCNTLALEGATDLQQALAEASSPTWAAKEEKASPPDLFLLSDGAITWGEQDVHSLTQTLRTGAGGALFAYQTGLTGTAVGVLENLARESGGAVFSVANEQEIDTAATAHRKRPWRLIDVVVTDGDDLLLAGRPTSIYPGQSLLLVGRGRPGNEVLLRVARGEEVQTVRIPLGEAIESDTAARLYGQVAVGQLEDLGAAVEDVAVAYARHFRVPGQTCSLLMLESDADYQRFNIRPEDDAFVVKSSAASKIVANKLDELGATLTNPRKTWELWLKKLENTPGVQLQLSTAMKLAMEQLPVEAITVTPPRLACKSRSHEDLSEQFLEALRAEELDYDAVAEEAARRLEALGPADALKAVSSLVESKPGDPVIARDVAFSAMEWNLSGQAYWLLKRVAESRPYEPQVYQALAQCAAAMGKGDLAILYYEILLGGQWHERYQDVRRVAGVEYLHLLRRIHRGEIASHLPDYAQARLDALANHLGADKADLVVTLMWNTDRTDVDLQVLEPSGEVCYYKNRSTRAGGEITRDVTEGYGPEMYILKTAPHGKYVVKADYYGSDANRTQARTKVFVTIYEDFGGRKERVTKKTVTLSRSKELREVAEVFVEKQ